MKREDLAGEKQTCSACGATFYWVVNAGTGKTIPMQLVRTIYAVTGSPGSLVGHKIESLTVRLDPPTKAEAENALHMVSHFETCPHPERFSRQPR